MEKPKTYRLREIPSHADRLVTVKLLSKALGDVTTSDIEIFSLALTRHAERPATKTATLMFNKLPSLIVATRDKATWVVPVDGLQRALILDTHFLGITQLHDVPDDQHEFDLLVISGLSSHPFGSWQLKDDARTFMWIRDSLPQDISGTRIFLYGYETTLKNSDSFQSITDLAIALLGHLYGSVWTTPHSRPLLFLAHSLGGILLKAILITLSESRDAKLALFQGGIFFGVPSMGMEVSHLLALVQDQPNEDLLDSLSRESPYLQSLDDRFSGVNKTLRVRCFWAYETKTSLTVLRQEDGSFARTGSRQILVTRDSATRNKYGMDHTRIFPIDEDHSGLVKFSEGSNNYELVLGKLRDVIKECITSRIAENQKIGTTVSQTLDDEVATLAPPLETETSRPSYKGLLKNLSSKVFGERMDQIEERFAHTFDWIFDETVTELPQWLRSGEGIYWIRGKPGSGKSTMMKFIYHDERTWNLLQDWKSDALKTRAGFFFHNRGVTAEKSFIGLLTSMVWQILKNDSHEKIYEVIKPALMNLKHRWRNIGVEHMLRLVLQQTQFRLDIFLFIDALDEYDGPPEFIGQFVRDLVQMTEGSQTRIKICFSSRPWDSFQHKFAQCPSLEIHAFTTSDIRQYCLGRVQDTDNDKSSTLIDLIPQIVSRASGVFLWVRLVMDQLIREIRTSTDRTNISEVLTSLPDDLHAFYDLILQRIPYEKRREAFLIIQVVSQDPNLDLLDVICVIKYSLGNTFEESLAHIQSMLAAFLRDSTKDKQKLMTFQHSKPRDRANKWFSRYWDVDVLSGYMRRFTESCGGLVEADASIGSDQEVQSIFGHIRLMHQTVKEFIDDPKFKNAALGRHAMDHYENIPSLLAGTNLCWQLGEGTIYENHPCELFRRAEESTGQSHKRLLDSFAACATQSYLKMMYERRFLDIAATLIFKVPSSSSKFRIRFRVCLLEFAVKASLFLYLQDTLREEPYALENYAHPLLAYAIPTTSSSWSSIQKTSEMFQFLLQNGRTVSKEPIPLRQITWPGIFGLQVLQRGTAFASFASPGAVLWRIRMSRWELLRNQHEKILSLLSHADVEINSDEVYMPLIHDEDLDKRIWRMPYIYTERSGEDIRGKSLSIFYRKYNDVLDALETQLDGLLPPFYKGNVGKKNWGNRHMYPVLHVSDTYLSEILLDHGAKVNAFDKHGNTPLDFCIMHFRMLDSEKAYNKILFLIQNGGVRKGSTRKQWDLVVSDCESLGFNTTAMVSFLEEQR